MQTDEIIEKNKARIRANAEMKLAKEKKAFEAVSNVYKFIETDMFLNPRFNDKIEQMIFNEFGSEIDKYEEALRRHSDGIHVYQRILEELV